MDDLNVEDEREFLVRDPWQSRRDSRLEYPDTIVRHRVKFILWILAPPQTSLESILTSSESNLHKFIDEIPQIFASTSNGEYYGPRSGETNGQRERGGVLLSTGTSASSIGELKGVVASYITCSDISKKILFNTLIFPSRQWVRRKKLYSRNQGRKLYSYSRTLWNNFWLKPR